MADSFLFELSEDELASQPEEFYQQSQKCTICGVYLWGWDEIVADPRNANCMAHAACVTRAVVIKKNDEPVAHRTRSRKTQN